MNLCFIEMGLAGIIMLVGMKSLGVFVMAMAAHSAYLAGKP